uniref:Uncharacterized protein n=1 Tax=Anopheles albimanus TaxID=7167 RepID=A0A182FH68_ANOAL
MVQRPAGEPAFGLAVWQQLSASAASFDCFSFNLPKCFVSGSVSAFIALDATTPHTMTMITSSPLADTNGLNHKSLIRRASSSFKHNASFVARLPTIRRHKSQSLHSPGNPKPPSGGSGRAGRCPRMTDINASSENLEVTNNGRPMNPSLSEDSVAETALSKKNSDAGLELACVSSLPSGGGGGPLVATGHDLVVSRTLLSTGGGGGHFGAGPSSSSRRSSFVSGIFSSAVQRRGSANENPPHATSVAINSNMLLHDNNSINHKNATATNITTTTTATTTTPTGAVAGAAAGVDAVVAAATTTTTTTTATSATTCSSTSFATGATAYDTREAVTTAQNVPTMLRFGGASALPILLCGQLQKELLVQQHTNR